MTEPITFIASLDGRGFLRFDDDGAGKLRLEVPASEMAALSRMLTLLDKTFTVTIQETE